MRIRHMQGHLLQLRQALYAALEPHALLHEGATKKVTAPAGQGWKALPERVGKADAARSAADLEDTPAACSTRAGAFLAPSCSAKVSCLALSFSRRFADLDVPVAKGKVPQNIGTTSGSPAH